MCIRDSPNNTVWVGGNIGNPLISYLDQIQPDDLAVMELSSFQLEIMTCSPQIAAILNPVSYTHLDVYKRQPQQLVEVWVVSAENEQRVFQERLAPGKKVSLSLKARPQNKVRVDLDGDTWKEFPVSAGSGT